MRHLSLMMLLLFAGCATVQVTPLNAPSKPMSPKSPDDVRVYLTKKPAAAYEEAYMIRSDAGDSEQALKAMRNKAAELGCDGLVITGNADRVVTSPDASGNATVSMREGFLGSCIVFE